MNFKLAAYKDGKLLEKTKGWRQAAIEKKNASQVDTSRTEAYTADPITVEEGKYTEIKITPNGGEVTTFTQEQGLTAVSANEEVAKVVATKEKTVAVQGVKAGETEVTVKEVKGDKEVVKLKVTVTAVPSVEEPEPEQPVEESAKYTAAPLNVVVGKATYLVVKDAELNATVNINKCTVTADQEGIVELAKSKKNRWMVKGLKPGKVVLTIKNGDKVICTCNVNVAAGKVSKEDQVAITRLRNLGYEVTAPVAESLEKSLNEDLSEFNGLDQVRQEVESTGYSTWVYGGSGYVAECIEIIYADGVYTANYYTSTESGNGDTDPEYITESEDFREVIKFLVDDGWFNSKEGEYQDITAEQAREYLARTEKPLTEDLSEDKLQVMEDYLKSTKFASLDTEWEDTGDFYVDIIGAYLDYNTRTSKFTLGLSIYHASEDNNANYPERYTDEEEFSYDSLAEMYEDEECKEFLDRIYVDNLAKLTKPLTETKCKDCGGELKDNKCTSCNRDWNLEKCNHCGGEVKDGKCTHCDHDFTVDHCKTCGGEIKDGKCTSCNELVEETHAQYAKPEGNRVQAYNNALKYAKKAEVPFIYGYSNHTGKFFALEQPIKVSGRPVDAEKEFRSKYKNCAVVYMVYPDKTFLNEVLYNFTPEEQAEYGIDEEGQSLEGFDTYVRCNWCGEVYPEFDCKFEANLGWLCPRCQDEVRSHGGPLTIVEEPSEEQIQATLEN